MIRRTIALAALTLASACASAPKNPPPPVLDLVTTKLVSGGEVIGFIDAKTGAHVWRAIPFAAPPVGDLRWRAPQPVNDWDGVRSSLAHAPWCPQIRSSLDDGSSADAVPEGGLMGQEDCLYLNVHAPADSAGKNLPVMMWIHGGSNTWGRAEQYDPSDLVVDEDVIVVVAQYRLGPLGWFAHPALSGTAQTEMDRSANFGTMDQIAALNWIKANAATFGGNPNNVTIFGESAGGHNVAALLGSSRAKGLFHKAIIQSGSFRSMPLKEAQTEHPQSGEKIAAHLVGDLDDNAATATALRGVSAARLFAAYPGTDGESDFAPPRIIQDGVVLPATPLRDAFKSTATFNNVPVITGTNKDETKLWNLLDDRLVKWRFGMIPAARDPEFYNTLSKYPSRMWRAASVDSAAEMMAAGGHADVWTYRFDWDEGRKYLGADFGQLFGAAHSLEIPFVMGSFRFLGDADKYIFTEENEAGRVALSNTMQRHWANFARSGNPGRTWPRWSANGDNIIIFDSVNDAGVRMAADKESEARIVSDLKADSSVTAEQRCIIFGAMRGWAVDKETFMPPACAAPAQ